MPGKNQDPHVERADHWSEANNKLNDAGHFIGEIAFSLEEAGPEGGGVVDASLKASESLMNTEAKLTLYSVNNITSGTDAQGEVTVRLEKGGRIVNGQGADTDIVIASAKAYINAVNKLRASNRRKHPQVEEVEV